MSGLCVLVFPLDIDSASSFIDQVKALGIRVIGASSVMKGPGEVAVDAFFNLPFVTDPSFDDEFSQLIGRHEITHVFAPHGGVWSYFYKNKASDPSKYPFVLCEPSPYLADWLKFKPSYEWADNAIDSTFVEFLDLSTTDLIRAMLSRVRLAGLHKQFVSISGQCDDEKLFALSEIVRVVPHGDVVEIGSLLGKSAFALGWLAQHHKIGSFLSVDPWDKGKVVDQGSDAKILNDELDESGAGIRFERIFASFLGSVSLLDNIGYIKDTSENAVSLYLDAAQLGVLNSAGLGEIPISGEIALLHIDGNHRYDFVSKDVEYWAPHIKPGGWLLLDDYCWAFGDGPKLVGDELIQTDTFDICFTMSDTLFLRKRLVV